MKKPQKKGLGKGLGALIPPKPVPATAPAATVEAETKDGIQRVPLQQITPNPNQPRKEFAPDALRELADTIARNGLLQPLVVRWKNGRYEIIAGERRYRALQQLGATTAPVIIRDVGDRESLVLTMIENLQRADLNPIEEACGYQLLQEEGVSHEEIAQRVGKKRSTITNQLRLLKLPRSIIDALAGGKLDAGHARALLGMEDRPQLEFLAQQVIRDGLSVRQTEQLVKRYRPGKPATKRPPAKQDPNLRDLETRFSHALGTPVVIKKSKRGGKVVISFSSHEDFDRIFAALLPSVAEHYS